MSLRAAVHRRRDLDRTGRRHRRASGRRRSGRGAGRRGKNAPAAGAERSRPRRRLLDAVVRRRARPPALRRPGSRSGHRSARLQHSVDEIVAAVQRLRRQSIPTRSGSSGPPTTAAWRRADCSTPAGSTPRCPTGPWCCGRGTTTPCGATRRRCSARASPPTPRTRCSARSRTATDGSVLGTLREWGAIDLVMA